MGEGFHLFHVPLVGDGWRELRLFQGHNCCWGWCGWLELPKVLCLPARQPGSPLHRAGLVCDLRVSTELQSGQMAVCRRAQPGPRAPGPRPPPPAPAPLLQSRPRAGGRVGTCGGPRRLLSCLTQPWEPPGRRSCLAD